MSGFQIASILDMFTVALPLFSLDLTSCFGTFAGFGPVDPDIVWLKLKSLVDGAAIASKRMWGRDQ